MSALRKNIAGQHISFALNSTAAGAPVTAGGAGTVVIDGGSQASCAGTFTHKGTGQWDYAPTQTETNGASIGFTFTGTGAIQVGMQFFTIGYDPTLANVPANTTQLAGQAVTAAAGVTFPTSVASPTNITAGTITTVGTLTTYTGNTPQTGDNFARLGAPAGASVSADIAAIKSDTGTVLTDVNTGAGAIYTRLGAPSGASLAADVAAVKTDTAAVKVQTDKLTFTLANKVDANALAVNGNVTAAANVAHTMQAIARGTVGAAASTTSITTSAVTSPSSVGASGQFIGRTMLFDADTATTNLQGQATNITANTTGATPTFTVTALTTAPASGDTFSIV